MIIHVVCVIMDIILNREKSSCGIFSLWVFILKYKLLTNCAMALLRW